MRVHGLESKSLAEGEDQTRHHGPLTLTLAPWTAVSHPLQQVAFRGSQLPVAVLSTPRTPENPLEGWEDLPGLARPDQLGKAPRGCSRAVRAEEPQLTSRGRFSFNMTGRRVPGICSSGERALSCRWRTPTETGFPGCTAAQVKPVCLPAAGLGNVGEPMPAFHAVLQGHGARVASKVLHSGDPEREESQASGLE